MQNFDSRLAADKAREIRRYTMECIGNLGVGHVGGCLSIAEVLSVLYYGAMHVDPADAKMEGRDRLIVSKGHAGPAVYAALASKGFIDYEDLSTLNQIGTNLPSHCDMNRTNGIDMTTGSLGQGFSCAVGIALGSQIKRDGATIYTIIGDGESQEGQIWEAAMYAAQKGLGNLIAFTDYNKMQIDGTVDEVNSLGDLAAKWRAFGWHVIEVDGHDVDEIYRAVASGKQQDAQPTMILLHTVKGKGVSYVEAAGVGNHNMPITAEQLAQARDELN
ncbi:MAG: transketolase [Clostridiales bacterium]|nr:transketolase [Clostridiales bacterium]